MRWPFTYVPLRDRPPSSIAQSRPTHTSSACTRETCPSHGHWRCRTPPQRPIVRVGGPSSGQLDEDLGASVPPRA